MAAKATGFLSCLSLAGREWTAAQLRRASNWESHSDIVMMTEEDYIKFVLDEYPDGLQLGMGWIAYFWERLPWVEEIAAEVDSTPIRLLQDLIRWSNHLKWTKRTATSDANPLALQRWVSVLTTESVMGRDTSIVTAAVTSMAYGAEQGLCRDLLQTVLNRIGPIADAIIPRRQGNAESVQWLIGEALLKVVIPNLGTNEEDQRLLDVALRAFLPTDSLSYEDTGGALRAAISRYRDLAVADDSDPFLVEVLTRYWGFAGIEDFRAACAHMQKYSKAKILVRGHLESRKSSNPLVWPIRVLRCLKPPTEADQEQGIDRLAEIDPKVLFTAALFAPGWAGLVETLINWPGLRALLYWLQGHNGAAPWSRHSWANDEAGAIDRDGALKSVDLLGRARLDEIRLNRTARSLYAPGFYYLEAILGINSADVMAGFWKRDKQAVRALGLLPDKGDVLDRYLAIRKFVKQSRKFGGEKRQASEQIAAECALDNLTSIAGFTDRSQLEWAMEALAAEEAEASSRKWLVGEYTLWLEPIEQVPIVVERNGKRLKNLPAKIRQAAAYEEIKEVQADLRDQWVRIRRRLEVAMATGEVMDRQQFAPALVTPAGRSLLPHLVLRCWPLNGEEPVDLLNFVSLTDQAYAIDSIAKYQVVHPLHLIESGTLTNWQRRLIQLGVVQPFNQVFREVYDQKEPVREVTRFQGQQAWAGSFVQRLKRLGWRLDDSREMVRCLPEKKTATFSFEDGFIHQGGDVLTIGEVWFSDVVDALSFSEVTRDIDLATVAGAADRAFAPVSREVVAARSALVKAFFPDLVVENDFARLGPFRVSLISGATFGADGNSIELPDLEVPNGFPYRQPDSETAKVVARIWHLSAL